MADLRVFWENLMNGYVSFPSPFVRDEWYFCWLSTATAVLALIFGLFVAVVMVLSSRRREEKSS